MCDESMYVYICVYVCLWYVCMCAMYVNICVWYVCMSVYVCECGSGYVCERVHLNVYL